MYKIYILFIPLTVIFVLTLSILSNNEFNNDNDIASSIASVHLTPYNFRYLPQKDTIYILSDNYIEISLKEQVARLIKKNESVITYHISTGNPSLKKGLETPPGLYTVQSKSPVAISKQFNNAKMYNWIGFNGNFGFHGLDGRGYYYNLGKRPSSHGCVRISREDGEALYKAVKRGTPVIVFHDKPARTLVFSKLSDFSDLRDIFLSGYSLEERKLLNKRLKNLYKSNSYLNTRTKIFLDGKTILNPGGIDIGLASEIPFIQKNPIHSEVRYPSKSDNLSYFQRLIIKDTTVKNLFH
jgi:hypothetical protein